MTWFPWLITLAALVATVLNIRRRRECFAVWVVTNTAWMVIDMQAGLPAQACLFAIYAVLAIWGLFAWADGKERK
jgi:nicotinamide riboside transporter PnuC